MSFDGLSGGVGQNPFLLAPAREDVADVAAARRDDDVRCLNDFVGPRLPIFAMAAVAAGLISVPGLEPPDGPIPAGPFPIAM